MKRFLVVGLVILVGCCLATVPIQAKYVENFSNMSSWVCLGTARKVSTAAKNVIRLTTDNPWQDGAAWYRYPVDLSNNLDIKTRVFLGQNDLGADGIVFVFQNSKEKIRAYSVRKGEFLGYEGIKPSVGVEIDTWQNINEGDPMQDHIAIDVNGNVHHSGQYPLVKIPNIEDGKEHLLEIKWNAKLDLLNVYLDNKELLSCKIDLPRILGSYKAYIGFTGATGGAYNYQYFVPVSLSIEPIQDFVNVSCSEKYLYYGVNTVKLNISSIHYFANKINVSLEGSNFTLLNASTNAGNWCLHNASGVVWINISGVRTNNVQLVGNLYVNSSGVVKLFVYLNGMNISKKAEILLRSVVRELNGTNPSIAYYDRDTDQMLCLVKFVNPLKILNNLIVYTVPSGMIFTISNCGNSKVQVKLKDLNAGQSIILGYIGPHTSKSFFVSPPIHVRPGHYYTLLISSKNYKWNLSEYAPTSAHPVRILLLNSGATPTTPVHTVAISHPPVASFTYTNTNTTVTFNASKSYDPDGYIKSYFWNFGDGSYKLTTTPVIKHTYPKPGTYKVSLTVTDNSGYQTTVSKIVNVTKSKVITPTVPASNYTVFNPMKYDTNHNGRIELNELEVAIKDWLNNKIDMKELEEVITIWLG